MNRHTCRACGKAIQGDEWHFDAENQNIRFDASFQPIFYLHHPKPCALLKEYNDPKDPKKSVEALTCRTCLHTFAKQYSGKPAGCKGRRFHTELCPNYTGNK